MADVVAGRTGWLRRLLRLRDSQPAGARARRPLFHKYALAIGALVCGALLVSGLVQAFFAYQEARGVLANIQRERAAVAAQALDHYVREMEDQLRWATPAARPIGAEGLEERREDYYRLLRQFPAASEVRYLDALGREQIHVSRLGLDAFHSGRDYSHAPEFRYASTSRPYFSPVYFVADSEPYMNISLTEPGGDGGTTLVEVNLKFVGDIVCCTRVGRTGVVYVVDINGRLIAHPDLSLVLRKTNLADDPEPMLPQVRGAVERPRAQRVSRDLDVGHDAEGRPVVASYQPVQRTGWLVFVENPLAEALRPLYEEALRTSGVLLLGLMVSILVSLALARRMAAPIELVQAGAARIDAGALDQRIEVRTGDEIEALADEFNRMGARLRESYAGLEEQVEERTRNLAAAIEELTDRSRQLEEASVQKSQAVANLSHELKSPLTGVVGYAELLLRDAEQGTRRREYAENILTSADHLLALIEETLQLARAEAGKLQLRLASVGVEEMLQSCITMLGENARRRDVELSLAVEDRLATIEADERKVKQIVLNLLSNAIKFTAGGRVEVRARRSGGEVEIAVSDTGVGIPPEDQGRIFEPFQQVGDEARRPNGGTGLGLALSKYLAELHGGRIEVQSEPGAGSTFSLVLPAQPELTAPAIAVSTPVLPTGDPRRAVLIVEDDQLLAQQLRGYLARAELPATVTASGPDGLEAARQTQPAIIILDLDLPNLDAWGFLARAKTDPALRGIPVIVVSVLHEHQRAVELGAADYVVKPVSRAALLAAVRRQVAAEPPERQAAPEDRARKTVLVIEDDPQAADLVEAVLGPEGYSVVRTTSGLDGLARARAERPGLVIVDLLLPGADGFAVVHGLRTDPQTATVPIIIFTGKTLTHAEQEWLGRNADHLARKGSFPPAELAAVVHRLCPPPAA